MNDTQTYLAMAKVGLLVALISLTCSASGYVNALRKQVGQAATADHQQGEEPSDE